MIVRAPADITNKKITYNGQNFVLVFSSLVKINSTVLFNDLE